MDQNKIRTALKDYYASSFDLEGLKQVIDFSSFNRREFGFATLQGKFYRNMSFEKPKELQDFLADRAPLHAYIGAVYKEPPTRENPIHKVEWIGHELVFDIDLNEYDVVRKHVCDCQGANQVCIRCWQLVNIAILIIDETLRFDFGMNEITWNFSGRRGVHGWIKDKSGFKLDQEHRMAIIDYLTVIHGEEETARVESRKNFPPDFRKRIEYNVFQFFLKNARHKDLTSLGLNSTRASNIRSQIKRQDGVVDETLAKNFNRDLARINKYDEILRRWVPRIDHKVTIDTRRLLRLPNSIHGKTGCVARILSYNDLENFDPKKEPSIF
ncbi:MAG: DNA primase catalytic subunit PriS [Candidatus Hodarchaeales archaeon]